MSAQTKRAYRYRFYPTPEHVRQLAQTFGCSRFVYNWGLSTRKRAYFDEGKSLSYHDLAARLPALKQQFPFLRDVSSVPIQQALRHLERAYVNFFEGRAAYPTFKKKRSDQSATYAANAFTWDGTALTLAKMDAPLAIAWHRPLPPGAKPSSVTVSKDSAGRYARLSPGAGGHHAAPPHSQGGRPRPGPHVVCGYQRRGGDRQPEILPAG